MFGVDFCDVKMKSTYCLKFSTNVFMVESKVSFRHQILIMMFQFQLVFLQSKLAQRKNKFRISQTRVARIIDSCFKDNHINEVTAEITRFNSRKNLKKTSCISSQRTIVNKNSQREKIFKKITGSNTSCKLLFLLIFFAKQRRLKRLGKTVVQLQEKI